MNGLRALRPEEAQMRAAVYERYGTPEVLRVVDLPAPRPGPGEVLVEVVATSVNLSDWEGLTGSPLYARLGGIRTPRRRILGSDIAGRVSSVGVGVTRFRPGHEVYGDNLDHMGGFAEYVVVPEASLALKPPALSFTEASAIPQSAAIADQGIAGLEPGDRVLVNGGGGGSGSLAIQLAKRAGAHVTGVDNDRKLAFMKSLGADEVLDHRRVDFTRTGQRYDRILDLVAERKPSDYRRALSPDGRYACVGGSVATMLRVALAGLYTAGRLEVLVVREGPAHFENVAALCAAGEVAVQVDREFPLEAVPEALAYLGDGLALGKVVVRPRGD